MSELQPFEKITDLRDSILYAANNWKINKGWTSNLAIINRLCEEREQMIKFLREYLDTIELGYLTHNDSNSYDKIKQLIQQATTIK